MTDHSPEVLGVDVNLQKLTATLPSRRHRNIIGVIDNPTNEVLQRFSEHDQFSCSASADSAASAGSSLPASSLSAFAAAAASASAAFLAFSASSRRSAAAFSAAAIASCGSDLPSGVCRVPSAPGRPLNFCQSPVTFRSASTCSDGCAPTPSQY